MKKVENLTPQQEAFKAEIKGKLGTYKTLPFLLEQHPELSPDLATNFFPRLLAGFDEPENKGKIITVGIGGRTGAGKTELAGLVAKYLQTVTGVEPEVISFGKTCFELDKLFSKVRKVREAGSKEWLLDLMLGNNLESPEMSPEEIDSFVELGRYSLRIPKPEVVGMSGFNEVYNILFVEKLKKLADVTKGEGRFPEEIRSMAQVALELKVEKAITSGKRLIVIEKHEGMDIPKGFYDINSTTELPLRDFGTGFFVKLFNRLEIFDNIPQGKIKFGYIGIVPGPNMVFRLALRDALNRAKMQKDPHKALAMANEACLIFGEKQFSSYKELIRPFNSYEELLETPLGATRDVVLEMAQLTEAYLVQFLIDKVNRGTGKEFFPPKLSNIKEAAKILNIPEDLINLIFIDHEWGTLMNKKFGDALGWVYREGSRTKEPKKWLDRGEIKSIKELKKIVQVSQDKVWKRIKSELQSKIKEDYLRDLIDEAIRAADFQGIPPISYIKLAAIDMVIAVVLEDIARNADIYTVVYNNPEPNIPNYEVLKDYNEKI